MLVTAVVRDQAVVAGAVLRVWAGEEVAGGAFLVAPDLVATSTDVVTAALATEPGPEPRSGEPPTGEAVWLDFPLLRTDDDRPVQARGLVERWSGGAALLRLTGDAPTGSRMPPLRRVDPLAHRSFAVLGFPPGLADGIWATGRIRPTEDAAPYRLHSNPGEQRVVAGFSGTPVWESRTGAVVGMAVTRDDEAEILPIDAVIGRDPETMPGPYQGLRVFDESSAHLFFGRGDEVRRVLDALDRVPVVAVAGPSGVGKSSLVRAGVVPRLRAAGAGIVYLRAVCGAQVPDPLPGDGPDVVIVVDQFEELAALDPPAARDLFETLVRRTRPGAGPRARAVVTLRWTTLDEMLTPELVGTLEAGTVLVGPPTRAQLQEAIVRPAAHPPGLAFEPGLVETILDDAGAEPGRLPLVESLLADLWDRREGGFLTRRDYAAAGGVAGALAQHAETVVAGLRPESDGALRRLLTALARPDPDGRFVRRPVPVEELPPAHRALVPALTAGRLLTVSRSSGDADVVELAHQALIEHWPRLQEWLAQDRDFLAWREQITDHRELWEVEGRDDGALLRGAVLARAPEWLPARAADVSAADRDYLRRSTARQRREVRRWRMVTTVVTALTLAAATLAVVSARSGDEIAVQLANANADALGREAQSRLAEDPSTAARLALAAWREDPDSPQARTALARSYVAMRSVRRELPGLTGGPIRGLLLGGDTAVLRADPHPVVVTGLSGPAPRHRELVDVAPDRQFALSPDGRWLADQTADRTTVRLRDLAGGSPPVPLPSTPGTQAGLGRFSPDGERLAWVTVDGAGTGRLRIWDLRTNTEVPHNLGPLSSDVGEVALTGTPDRVVVRHETPESAQTRLVVHSLADGSELGVLPAGALLVLRGAAAATCEDGPRDAPDNLLLTPTDGSAQRRIELVPGLVNGLAWCGIGRAVSGTGTHLIESLEGDRAVRMTDLRTGEAFEVAVPGAPPGTFQTITGHPTIDVQPTVGVLPTPDGPVTLFARGSALLSLGAEPVPAAVEGQIIGVDGPIRAVRTHDGLHTADNTTGRRLGEAPGAGDRHSLNWFGDGSLWNARLVPGGWRVTRYQLPALRQADDILLPGRDGGDPVGDRGNPPQVALQQEPGRLFAIGDGVLTGWDLAAGRRIGSPIRLGTTELQVGFHRSFPHMRSRPGHPGQVAVLGIDEVQVWDVPLGRLVAVVPAEGSLDVALAQDSPIAFDPVGERLAVLGRDGTVQLWDVDTATQVRPPTPAPGIANLVGFDADGYLVAARTGEVGAQPFVVFIDVDAGVEAGSVETDRALGGLDIAYLEDDRRTLRLDDLRRGRALGLPVTAHGWRDGLCAVADRPFTRGELQLLPPGTPTEPPCRSG